MNSLAERERSEGVPIERRNEDKRGNKVERGGGGGGASGGERDGGALLMGRYENVDAGGKGEAALRLRCCELWDVMITLELP